MIRKLVGSPADENYHFAPWRTLSAHVEVKETRKNPPRWAMYEPTQIAEIQPQSKLGAWGNVLAITLLTSLVAGLRCFVLLGKHLLHEVNERQLDLFHAAAWWEVGFTVALIFLLGVVIFWQRARGSSLADLGWGRPTPPRPRSSWRC